LAVADQIAIKSYYHEKLNETVVVRPDGMISLQLIDEVLASGYTPAELDTMLTEKYTKFFDSPDLSVIVLSFTARI
jgi:protein involved in polysaccharide export with SLBB domain